MEKKRDKEKKQEDKNLKRAVQRHQHTHHHFYHSSSTNSSATSPSMSASSSSSTSSSAPSQIKDPPKNHPIKKPFVESSTTTTSMLRDLTQKDGVISNATTSMSRNVQKKGVNSTAKEKRVGVTSTTIEIQTDRPLKVDSSVQTDTVKRSVKENKNQKKIYTSPPSNNQVFFIIH